MNLRDVEELAENILEMLTKDPEKYKSRLKHFPKEVTNWTADEFRKYLLDMPGDKFAVLLKDYGITRKDEELQWLNDNAKILGIITGTLESLEVVLKIAERAKYQDLLKVIEKNRLNLYLRVLDENCDLISKKEDGNYELSSFGKYFLDKFVKTPLKDYSEHFPEK